MGKPTRDPKARQEKQEKRKQKQIRSNPLVKVTALSVGVLAVFAGVVFYLYQKGGIAYNKGPVPIDATLTKANPTSLLMIEEFKAKNMSAFVVGYTGEVGKELVRQLVQSKVFERVVLIGRRRVQYEDPVDQNVEQRVVDFDKIEEHRDAFRGFDVGFCCLGTTRGKAGAEGFKKVDYDYIFNTAKVARENGCSHFHLVSSQGANKDSFLLYPQVKGQVEEAVSALGFTRVTIYRPGMLMCDREERRPMEAFFRFLLRPVAAVFPTFITIPVPTVARAMLQSTVVPSDSKAEILENKNIHERSQRWPM